MRNCTSCNATMIEGITPMSPGWCSAECDLPGSAPTQAGSEVFYGLDSWGGKQLMPGECLVFVAAEHPGIAEYGYVPWTILGDYSWQMQAYDPQYLEVTAGEGGCELVTPATIGNIVINGVVSV